MGGLDVGAGGLDGGPSGGADAIKIRGGDTAGTEDVAVGKVSGESVSRGYRSYLYRVDLLCS